MIVQTRKLMCPECAREWESSSDVSRFSLRMPETDNACPHCDYDPCGGAVVFADCADAADGFEWGGIVDLRAQLVTCPLCSQKSLYMCKSMQDVECFNCVGFKTDAVSFLRRIINGIEEA